MIPPDVTRVILLRHGEVHPEDVRGLYGQADIRLSEHGERQSEAAGRWLSRAQIDAVYSSDLRRAHYLATCIASHHGLTPHATPALRERHFGDWQNLKREEIAERYPDEHRQYTQSRFTMRAPGGAENFADVQTRVLGFLRELLARHRGQQIVLTAHSGPNRLILADALMMPIEALFTFDQAYCCRNIIDFPQSDSARVRLLNGTDHLEG